MQVVGLHPSIDNMNIVQKALKRLFDIVMSLIGLVLLSPVMLVIALLLRFKGKGGIVFKQERVGLGGKPFCIYKFRTMVELDEGEPQLCEVPDGKISTPLQVTLRRFHLDELLQLWNVLKGDMSFVGPRPERQFFIDKINQYTGDYQYIYIMRPGITSEASIYNGYTDTMEKMLKRLELDVNYLRNRTLWMDFCIILNTLLAVFVGGKVKI